MLRSINGILFYLLHVSIIIVYIDHNAANSFPNFEEVCLNHQTIQIRNINSIDLNSLTKVSLFDHLKGSFSPIVYKNSPVSSWFRPKPSDIHHLLSSNNPTLFGLYKQSDNPYFGPYFDNSRPFSQLSTIMRQNPYDSNVSVSSSFFRTIFFDNEYIGNLSDYDHPPYWAYSTDCSSIQDTLESSFDIPYLLNLMSPTMTSSVNLWFGRYPGTTPCHYDGYNNLYVQLYGHKRFYFIDPGDVWTSFRNNHSSADSISDIFKSFPFLHPSYGQCIGNFSKVIHNLVTKNQFCQDQDRNVSDSILTIYTIDLEPGDLLYIPSFWIHEVKSLNMSISLNVWINIEESSLFETIISTPIPLLSAIVQSSSLVDMDMILSITFPFSQHQVTSPWARVALSYGIIVSVVYHTFYPWNEDDMNQSRSIDHILSSIATGLYHRYEPLLQRKELQSIDDFIQLSTSSNKKHKSFSDAISRFLQKIYSIVLDSKRDVDYSHDSNDSHWMKAIISCHPKYYEDLEAYSTRISDIFKHLFSVMKYSRCSIDDQILHSSNQSCTSMDSLNEIWSRKHAIIELWLMNYIEYIFLNTVRLDEVAAIVEGLKIFSTIHKED